MELDLPRLRNYLTCYFEAKLTSWFLQENACGSRYKIVMNMKVNHFVARALVKNSLFPIVSIKRQRVKTNSNHIFRKLCCMRQC